MTYERISQPAFFGGSALLFAASAALITFWCGSMSAIGGMRMPGGWTMSMAWMPMPGQTWLSAAASFVAMWMVMVAMMLPSLLPVLWRYRQAMVNQGGMRLSQPTALVVGGYFFVWTAVGIAVFPMGAALAELAMRQLALARLVPVAIGVVVVIAGAFQFTAWKAHHLACCRQEARPSHRLSADAGAAWRHGLRLGLHCTYGCVGFTAILLVLGVMDLRVMALVTAAITAERLAPNGERVARAIGSLVIGVGLLLLARAVGGLA